MSSNTFQAVKLANYKKVLFVGDQAKAESEVKRSIQSTIESRLLAG